MDDAEKRDQPVHELGSRDVGYGRFIPSGEPEDPGKALQSSVELFIDVFLKWPHALIFPQNVPPVKGYM